ncbi:hypothetical protein HA402_009089 [Bradysia odoriphaga]|nr:hypothetical protein HA402_009089 [Bradysia odoriphaga]
MLADVQITDNPFDDVINVVSSLRLFVLILNELIAYKALDQKSLDASFFTKKIQFKVEQLDLCMIRLATGRFESKDKMEIIEKLLEILNDTVHPLLAQMIKAHSLSSIVSWLSHVVNEQEERNSRCLLLKSYSQLTFEQKIRYRAFSLLCYLSDGTSGCEAFEIVNEHEFNLLSNGDLCIVLHLIESMAHRPKQLVQAEWLSRHLKQLCMLHHKSSPISERIIDCLPIIVECINPFDNMTDEMISIVRDFLIKIKKNRYSPRIGVKMLRHLKRIARSYAHRFGSDEFENLFAQMKDFLKYPMYEMQFAAVDSLIRIFDKHWIGDAASSEDLKLFQRKLFDFLFAEEEGTVEDLDERDRHICVRGQLIAGLISSSYVLRKGSWFLLVELAFKHHLTAESIRPIVSALCQHHKMDHDMLVNDNISYLIGEWLIRHHQLTDFPWYFTTSKSQNDFFRANVNATTVCLLRHQPNALGDFATAMGRNKDSLMEAVLPDCLAYLTPILAGCDDISDRYKENGTEMYRILGESFGDLNDILRKQFLTVTENLLSNLWDNNKFTEFFHLEIDYAPESHNIDMNVFTKSLDYLQHISDSSNKNVHLITDFCANRPLQIYNFLLFKRLQLQNTNYVDEQLIHLFQYCVVVDKVAAFFVSDAARPQSKKTILIHKKASLLRDIVYFIGNILIGADVAVKLKLAACRYLRMFASQILPSCAPIFIKFLNFAVSSLIPLVQHNDRLLSASALECIKFLVMEQTDVLASEIALLDNFPDGDEFSQLRRVHSDIKYAGRSFSLTDEIDYFLKVDYRKIEGLASLKEQLSSKKNELIDMYNQLQHVHGFAEDCEKSLIHRLVFTLLQFVQGPDEAKAIEAAKCLGELGPSDLSSIVLQPDHQRHTYQFASTFDKATEDLCTAAFTELNRLLLHPDAKVLKAASSSLIFLLKSEIGKKLLDDFPYLHLFQVPSTQKRKVYNVPGTGLDLETIMLDEADSSHSVWLKRLTKVLFDLLDDKHLQEVASLQEPHSTKVQSIYLNKAVIKSMITVAECIRINNLNTMNKITLEYMHIARAAQYCEAYFTSIMYAELWALQIEASSPYTLKQIKSDRSLQEIMKTAYISIGDMDAVLLVLGSNWVASNVPSIDKRLRSDFVGNGCEIGELTGHLFTNLPIIWPSPDSCAWRLGDWNVLAGTTESNDFQQEFERHHYFALKCLQTTKDEKGVKDALKTARSAIISSLKHLSLECTNNIYHHLERLTLLQQIDDFCQVQFEKPDATVPNIFIKWKHQDGIQFTDFKYREPILAQRISIVKSAGVRAGRKLNSLFGEQQDVIQTMLLNLASECRVEGNRNLAIRYLAQLRSVCTSDVSTAKMLLEDAQLYWSIGKHLVSEKILNSLLKGGDIESHFTHVISRRLLGEYKAESYSDSVETLIEKNFQYSLDMLSKLKENRSACVDKGYSGEFIDKFIGDNQVKAYEAIAKYSDREYNQICVHMKSNEFGTKKQTLAKNMETLAENGQIKASMSSDTKRALTIMNANVNIDKKEVQTIETEKSKFLLLAITNYLKICYLTDDFDDRTVFRIISLWFANRANADVTAVLRSELPKIATYKFVPALPQISARIANGDEIFHRLIGDVMVRCATDHPQQTLYQLLALSNAYADDPATHKATKEPRVLGAAKILDKLRKDTRLREIVTQMERMCSTLITLANVKMVGDRGKEHISSRDLTAFHALSQLNLVHCPTLTLPVSKDGQYGDLITVHSWAKKHELCGGINAPVKIACICSNGRTYDQLLKGKDDLRQDAVMQQVFTIMNNMLRSNKETRKRKLHIRTYKIVPLSQRSGILEWCANTITMNDYLTSSNPRKLGAHQRYFPNDLAPQKCRSTISSYRTQKKSIGEKLSEFKRICEQFHPVFHNYFFEKFPRPGMWFERRLAYTNSVAITSMIGYILGIGDRHISNILIDQTTAELIHIDFGIAFEQSRVLPTPEKVPFRLTRDIIAGFGVSGVDGVFRKSCEKTMDVLRHNKSTIVTILEVLLYDPLHMWTLTRKEASKRQERQDVHVWASEEEATGDKRNAMAERALLRLQAKLNGQEEGLLTQQLTTEGQVDMLIKQAMNPLNWCQMFEGWQAYV